MDKENKHWFKRRRYGYGWVPVTWQGWLSIILFIAVVLGGLVLLADVPQNEFSVEVAVYLALVFAAMFGLLAVSCKKGPAPKWRWGKSRDDSDEDY